ncbi:MAG: hypothetical protein JWO43_493 [Candidatus Adlerbacteria bacterium]|nr:hypothetical protein [Candidatus Adlerbacteria bacterium]
MGILAVLALIAWGISYMQPKVAAPTAVVQGDVNILQGTATSTGDLVHTEHTDYYDIRVVYPAKTPLIVSSVEADAAARTTMEQSLLATINSYKTNLGEFDATMQEFIKTRGAPLALDITYKMYTSPKFVSYKYLVYEDTGGAHPNGYFSTFMFDGQGHNVQLSELFAPASDYLARISAESKKQITAELTKRLQDSGGADTNADMFAEGYAPKAENFQNFVVDGSTLKIFFPPYQVAAYAVGDFEVDIPLSQLQDILKK